MGCQRRGGGNIEPEQGVGAKLCSLQSSLGCQAWKPPRGQSQGRVLNPFLSCGCKTCCPGRSPQGGETQEAGQYQQKGEL